MGNRSRSCGPPASTGVAGEPAGSGGEEAAKLTHRFWLQKYSGLHQESEGDVKQVIGGSPMRQRGGVLARWRKQLSKRSPTSGGQSPIKAQPANKRPPQLMKSGAPLEEEAADSNKGAGKAGGGSHVLRSLSSSTWALLSPLTARSAHRRKKKKEYLETGEVEGGGGWLSAVLGSPRLFRKRRHASKCAWLAEQQQQPAFCQDRQDRVAWLESEQLQLPGSAINNKHRASQTAASQEPQSYANELAHCQWLAVVGSEVAGAGGASCEPQLSVELADNALGGSSNSNSASQWAACKKLLSKERLIEQLEDRAAEAEESPMMQSLIRARASPSPSRSSASSLSSALPASSSTGSPTATTSTTSNTYDLAATHSSADKRPAPRRLAKQKSQQTLRCASGAPPADRSHRELARAPSTGLQQLKSNFRRQVERQQSVDSYRIARELRKKQRGRQRDQRHKHQSNEAIPIGSRFPLGAGRLEPLVVGDEQPSICLPEPQPEPAAVEEEADPAARPNTLSLMGASTRPFVVATFSGSITPTYMTHHLQSPGRGAQAPKKYSNASTVSSSLCADVSRTTHNGFSGPADSESSLAFTVATPSPLPNSALPPQQPTATKSSGAQSVASLSERAVQEEAARRAQLAEHIYDNKCGLGEDMKFLASLPELCDITFLVGETREPVCAVKSVLAARSRVFHKILFGARRQAPKSAAHQTGATGALIGGPASESGSSAASGHKKLPLASGSPLQWSVTNDASGYGASPTGDSKQQQQQQQQQSTQVEQSISGQQQPAARSSITNERAESGSLSQASAGSQQPLIVGPGQTATPAPALYKGKNRPKGKKGSIRGGGGEQAGRLTRMFTKRASDPNIKHQNQHHQLHHQVSVGSSLAPANQSLIDKMSWCQMSTTMIIEEFEPDVFRQLIEYIHTGCVLLQARTLLGLLNAADYYGLEQLRRACLRFVSCCITVDTVCSLLSTAERYIQYKCTKSIVQKVLEFVDTHANEVFKLNAFGLLPEHVVRLILAREGLQAEEEAKYNGVYTWCEHYCRSYELESISDVMRNFLHLIQFHKISTQVLLNQIYPSRTVPDNVILIALADQLRPPPNQTPGPTLAAARRRMTLPNPGSLQIKEPQQASRGSAGAPPPVHSDHQPVPAPAAPRKSFSNGARLRQASLAQVSLSNVIRLSHKFSIKRRRSTAAVETGAALANRQQRAPTHQLARQQSALCSVAAAASAFPPPPTSKKRHPSSNANQTERDSIQLGQLILDAHLRERAREQELAEAARRQPVPQEATAAPFNDCPPDKPAPSTTTNNHNNNSDTKTAKTIVQTQTTFANQIANQQQQQHHQQTKRSFKDFRSISRRLFMRRSSSRQLHSQPSSLTSCSAVAPQQHKPEPSPAAAAPGNSKSRRNLLRIKRSDTVFEATTPGASY